MDFNYLTDEQILEEIAKNIELKRINKRLSFDDVANKGGCNKQTYSNFINQGTNVRIGTIISIFRSFGELDKLQKFFEFKEPFIPYGQKTKSIKKIHKPRKSKQVVDKLVWGEDQ